MTRTSQSGELPRFRRRNIGGVARAFRSSEHVSGRHREVSHKITVNLRLAMCPAQQDVDKLTSIFVSEYPVMLYTWSNGSGTPAFLSAYLNVR